MKLIFFLTVFSRNSKNARKEMQERSCDPIIKEIKKIAPNNILPVGKIKNF